MLRYPAIEEPENVKPYLHSLDAAILLSDDFLHNRLGQGCEAVRELTAHDDHATEAHLTREARDSSGLA